MRYDVVVVGGGPAGLSAALTLGRARKRVLLCDAGARRNAAAEHVHGFVTRDGITPGEFRRVGREQLAPYPNVEVRDAAVEEIAGERGAFFVRVAGANVEARRVLLCTGMIDELPELAGLRELWGKSIFVCPYCHAWEVRDRAFGYLAANVDALGFAILLRGWSSDVVVFTNGAFEVSAEGASVLAAAGVRLEQRRIVRLASDGGRLSAIEFEQDGPVPCSFLFLHPRQRQVPVVASLGLDHDTSGYVRLDDVQRQTSRAGIYAAGDLTSPMQSAIIAAAAGMQSAAMLNRDLTAELAASSQL